MVIRFALRPLVWLLSLFFISTLAITLTAVVQAASDAPASVYLPLVSTPKDRPTSEALIAAALQAGKLDEETALLYRVYASFEDPRLPVDYRGDDSRAGMSLALHEASARLDGLSAETQALLAPFFLPPSAEGSWHEQREASVVAATRQQLAASNAPAESNAKIKWLTTCQTDPNIKVWYQERYPEDATAAQKVCDTVRGEIWPRLVMLMGRKPMNDGAEANNGGDEQLDLYLVNANTGVHAYRGCDNTPSYLTVHRTRWNNALLTSAVMGAFLNSYDNADCMEYMWLYAATTTWAIDHVYPQDQWEHHYANDFLAHTDVSLGSYPVLPLLDDNGDLGEGTYLWVWYAANMLKTPQETVPLWWEGAMNPNSLLAVNDVMGDKGFDTEWKEFSGINWNNEPVDIYKDLDKMSHSTKPMLNEKVTLNGAQDRSYVLDSNVWYLAAHTFRFEFTDPTVRSVLFYNPFQDGAWPTADVLAYFRTADGVWHIDEWTTQYGKGFCRDLVAERVEELVIVISNDEFKDRTHKLKPTKPARLNATNVACRGWEYEGTATWKGSGDEYSIDDSSTVKATFMRVPFGDASGASAIDHFQVVEGSGTWTHTGSHVNCGGESGGSFTMTGGNSTNLFIFTKATDLGSSSEYIEGDRRYSGFGTEPVADHPDMLVDYTCTSGNPSQKPAMSALSWFKTETLATQQVSADGITITGRYTDTRTTNFTSDVYVWEWTMKALPPE